MKGDGTKVFQFALFLCFKGLESSVTLVPGVKHNSLKAVVVFF